MSDTSIISPSTALTLDTFSLTGANRVPFNRKCLLSRYISGCQQGLCLRGPTRPGGRDLTSLNTPFEAVSRELESAKVRKEALEALFHTGKISPSTYNYLSGALTDVIRDLEKRLGTLRDRGLDEELHQGEDNALALTPEGTKRETAHVGEYPSALPPPSTPPALEDSPGPLSERAAAIREAALEKPPGGNTAGARAKRARGARKPKKTSPKREREASAKKPSAVRPSGAHCRNPWNGSCRNTDIEVSIYYRNEVLPICRECWREISGKDLAW